MDRRIEVVDDARVGDEALGGRTIRFSRIGERGRGRLEALEVRNARFIGDGEQDDVAAFLGTPDGKYPHAR